MKINLHELLLKTERFFKSLPDKIKAFALKIRMSDSTVSDIKKAFAHVKPQKIKGIFLTCLAGVWLLTGIYTVKPGDQAVNQRFGKPLESTKGEGIHYALPFPLDRVTNVNMEGARRADVGMQIAEHAHDKNGPQRLQLLTGDENIISVQAIVHYKVADAQKYLFNINENDEILVRKTVESALLKLMTRMKVDDILSAEKMQAQNSVLAMAQTKLDAVDSGLKITVLNIQSIVPPDEVSKAFLDVTAAREDRETQINDAKGYYNSIIPKARGKANDLISRAEGYRSQKVNTASGDASKFNTMYAEYKKNSALYSADSAKYRLFLETMEKVLPKTRKYILDPGQGNLDLKLLGDSAVLTN